MDARIGVLIGLENRDDRKVVWVQILQCPQSPSLSYYESDLLLGILAL